MFADREDAARQLAALIEPLKLREPILLAIPRGGLVIGATLSKLLGIELDVLLCRKLRGGGIAGEIGAVSESGAMAIDRQANGIESVTAESLIAERATQLAEIVRWQKAFREVRPAAQIANRSVLIADDGIRTGSTMTAALEAIRRGIAFEVVVAVPVAPRNRLGVIRRRCDQVACVAELDCVQNLKDHYREFGPVDEEEALRLLKESLDF